MNLDDKNSNIEEENLTKAQRERIERNKRSAITLKKSKLIAHPYSKGDVISFDKTTIKIGSSKYKDTGGGFLLEEEQEEIDKLFTLVEEPAPVFEPDRPTCEECNKIFAKSWLFDTFDCKVCDECKNSDVHNLITRTEAMNEFLLKPCDIDKRDPPLKFITRKNPHNNRWGDMKLYLEIQVKKRALEVWGSEEKIEEELKVREEKRVLSKTKKYHKKMKELRMSMRSSLYNKTTAGFHVHEFGPETFNEEDDNYSHTCVSCGYEETYEKM